MGPFAVLPTAMMRADRILGERAQSIFEVDRPRRDRAIIFEREMVAQDGRKLSAGVVAIGEDIAHAAFVAASVIVDFHARDAVFAQQWKEGSLAARLDVLDSGKTDLDLRDDRGLGSGLVGSELLGHAAISWIRIFAASALAG